MEGTTDLGITRVFVLGICCIPFWAAFRIIIFFVVLGLASSSELDRLIQLVSVHTTEHIYIYNADEALLATSFRVDAL
jgi:hypothetical protein